ALWVLGGLRMTVRYRPDRKQQLYLCICRIDKHAPKIALDAEAVHQQHRAWLQDLADRGLLEASGPARDADGAHQGSIFILRAGSAAEARKLIEGDPQVREKQRIPEIVPWQRVWFEE